MIVTPKEIVDKGEEIIISKILPHMKSLMKSTVTIQKDGKNYVYKSTSINDAVAKDIATKEGFDLFDEMLSKINKELRILVCPSSSIALRSSGCKRITMAVI